MSPTTNPLLGKTGGSLNQRMIDQFNNQASSCGANEAETECEPAVTRNKDSPNQTNSENDSKTKNEFVHPKTSNSNKLREKRSFGDFHPMQPPCSCKQKCTEKIN